ncbi:ABC transporter substrate-binding protein [Marinomonas sp. 5E14-1]|uniref:ABC transporter substrate-binding protein n=1 Tax=Marinomonas sp. 5E14-1 TaxID=3153922 RepID=UPI003267CA2F
MYIKTLSALTIMLSASSAFAASESCGDLTIADMSWNSATLIANIDSLILTEGYNCNVELVPGDTNATGASIIERGEPDIAPELWSNALASALQKGVADKRIRIAGQSLSDGGEEGFWIPKYLVDENPALSSMEEILKHPELFKHPEDDSLGALYNCPAGWNCQISTGHLFEAFNMEERGFDLIDPGSGAGLSGSIAKAYERKEGWLGYYWAPTAVLGKYEMVKVDFGSDVNLEHYQTCLTQEYCEDPQPSMYPPAPVDTVTTEALATEKPEIYDYLTKRSFTNAKMNALLAWMESNQAQGDYAAEYFLKNNEAMWTTWVSADAAKKIKAALN